MSSAAAYRGIYPDKAIDGFDYKWHTARDEKRIASPNWFSYLVMDGEQCTGYYTYRAVPEGTYRDFRLCLLSLYLLPQYQRRDLGRRIR